MENRFQSFHYSFRASFLPSKVPSFPAVIVTIDDSSLEKSEPRSPINRKKLAEWIEEISLRKPELIVVDILLDRSVEESDDQALEKAIKRAKRVIIRDNSRYPALPRFAKAALGKGSLKFQIDSSGTVQTVCNNMTSCQSQEIFHQQILKNLPAPYQKQPDPSKDREPWMKINFSNAYSQIPNFKVHDIQELPENGLQGKVVFLGTSFPDLYPEYRTPFSHSEQFLQEVELLTDLIISLAQDEKLEKVPSIITSLILLGTMLLLAWVIRKFGALRASLLLLILLFIGFVNSMALFSFQNLESPFLFPAILLSLYMAGLLIRQSVQEKINLLEATLQLKQAKIDFLTNELHSHHLFNEFSRISVMIRQSPEAAREYLIEFAEMLRASLKYSDSPRVPVAAQVEYLNSYIRQQQLIFEEKIHFELNMERKLNVNLPWHIFYPFLENAVKYTESMLRRNKDKKATIKIDLSRKDDLLVFHVSNPFDPQATPASAKKGLKNLYERLKYLYPNQNARIEQIEKDEEWHATLYLPIDSF